VNHIDPAGTNPLAKRTDALLLRIIRLPVAEEYFGHEETNFCAFCAFLWLSPTYRLRFELSFCLRLTTAPEDAR
jgi:hypothetical protein